MPRHFHCRTCARDPLFPSVSARVPFNTSPFIDHGRYQHTVSANNGAALDTSTFKWGPGACAFDGTNDYVELANHSSLQIANKDFTIEAWVRINSTSGQKAICGKWAGTDQEFIFEVNGATPRLWFAPYSTGGAFITSSSTLSANTWYHLAARRSGSAFNLYIDGSSVASGTNSGTATAGANNLAIGAWGSTGYGRYWFMNGYIDDFRFTLSKPRTIAVPTAAFPTS